VSAPWNRKSAVTCIANCDAGAGHRNCNHFLECPVCGFDQYVPGFDCLACDTIAHLYPADLVNLDVAKLAAAMGAARDAALAERLAA
jgi:hypothetical protein